MKSRISFYNGALSRHYLRRFWPLWTSYFVILLLLLPGSVGSWINATAHAVPTDTADLPVYRSGIAMVYVSFFAGIVTAMAMYHYLYQTRSCGMMNALPIRRETMFATAWLTGVTPLLCADVLAALITALLFMPGGQVTLLALGKWLLMAACTNLAFYGFAVFCAVLTGNLLVLPAVYAVLSMTAAVAETCAREVLASIVYGMPAGGLKLAFLSPPAGMLQHLGVSNVYETLADGQQKLVYGAYQVRGLGALALYAAAGLALSAAALALYRRRRMETATDVVAIGVLKPVFQYCLSVGTALVLASLVYGWFFGGGLGGALFGGDRVGISGRTDALVVLLLLLLGAFLGYFAAEMLIQKTLHVFKGRWKDLLIVWAALIAVTAFCEFDATGYEKRVPAAEEVECAVLNLTDGELQDPETIDAILAFHRDVIDRRHECEGSPAGYSVMINYLLRGGKTMQRSYRIPLETDASAPYEGTLLSELEGLVNLPEPITGRVRTSLPVTPENIADANLYINTVDELGRWTGETVMLTAEEAAELYERGIRPDAEAGHIAYNCFSDKSPRMDKLTNCQFELELRLPATRPGDSPAVRRNGGWDSVYVQIAMDSENTLRWLREHTDVTVTPERELEAAAG